MENKKYTIKDSEDPDDELARYRELLENMPDAVQSVNDRGRVVYVNKRTVELYGYTEKELLCMMIDDLYAPDLWKDVGMGFRELIAKGSIFNIRTAVISKSGERIEVEVSSRACYNSSGRFTGTVSLLRRH